MKGGAYYNEHEPFVAAWLRNLIGAGLIPAGEVDERSIEDVRPSELTGFTQCHFFAGLGGWAYALRLAGWPDDRPVWTGSCPCQPYSVAGKGEGHADERDLWPVWSPLIRERRPAVVFGEQVANAIGHGWLDRSFADLEGEGYACGAAVLPACSVGAPHRRDRLWFVAVADADDALGRADEPGRHERDRQAAGRVEGHGDAPERGAGGVVGDALRAPEERQRPVGVPGEPEQEAGRSGHANAWARGVFIGCADGKARRIEPGVRLLAHGIPGRVGLLRGFGNAIVPQVAEQFIRASLDAS